LLDSKLIAKKCESESDKKKSSGSATLAKNKQVPVQKRLRHGCSGTVFMSQKLML
jgi:hypothetical protein